MHCGRRCLVNCVFVIPPIHRSHLRAHSHAVWQTAKRATHKPVPSPHLAGQTTVNSRTAHKVRPLHNSSSFVNPQVFILAYLQQQNNISEYMTFVKMTFNLTNHLCRYWVSSCCGDISEICHLKKKIHLTVCSFTLSSCCRQYWKMGTRCTGNDLLVFLKKNLLK